ncbi:phage BR0599 family protein, partial [Acinetobacter baumannii]
KLQMPRNLYTPGCLNTLFDSACGLLSADFAVNTSIDTNSTPNRILCDLSQPQGWFTQGVVEFLEGANIGIKRTVRLHEAGSLILTLPLLKMPEIGEAIRVYPGCDKRLETCTNRFNNRSRFRGAPFVPVPETSI